MDKTETTSIEYRDERMMSWKEMHKFIDEMEQEVKKDNTLVLESITLTPHHAHASGRKLREGEQKW